MPAGGSIVLTSSIWGKTGAADFAAYVTSKHANIGFMRVLAKELGPRGIRVNAVCPGWVRTRAALRSLGEVSAAAGIGEDEMLDQILAAQALPGLMEPEDVSEPLSVPGLRPRPQHHRAGGQRRPRRGDGVSGSLAGKRALVTGGASGIGRAIALAMAAEGCRVAIADRAPRWTRSTDGAWPPAAAQAFGVRADVADEAQVVALFDAVLPRLGGLDILVNNAGILIEKPLLETTARGLRPADRRQPARRLPGRPRGAPRDDAARATGGSSTSPRSSPISAARTARSTAPRRAACCR